MSRRRSGLRDGKRSRAERDGRAAQGSARVRLNVKSYAAVARLRRGSYLNPVRISRCLPGADVSCRHGDVSAAAVRAEINRFLTERERAARRLLNLKRARHSAVRNVYTAGATARHIRRDREIKHASAVAAHAGSQRDKRRICRSRPRTAERQIDIKAAAAAGYRKRLRQRRKRKGAGGRRSLQIDAPIARDAARVFAVVIDDE